MYAFSTPSPLLTPRNSVSPRRLSPSPLHTCKANAIPTPPQPNHPHRPSRPLPALSRRDILQLCTTACLALASPRQAEALSKKRILAKAGPPVELPSGVIYRDITIGKGYVPRDGDTVAIHYSLFYNDLEVESSRESQGLAASPIGFTFGAQAGPGAIMPGINVGMDGMKVGGLRLISVPPSLAFGEKGKPPLIPGSVTVDFAVSLLSCKRQGTNPNSIINPKAQAY